MGSSAETDSRLLIIRLLGDWLSGRNSLPSSHHYSFAGNRRKAFRSTGDWATNGVGERISSGKGSASSNLSYTYTPTRQHCNVFSQQNEGRDECINIGIRVTVAI
jgi:hypothetical protein